MQDSTHQTSKLRQLRNRVGCSAAELARIAGLAPNTVLNAERGKVTDPQTRRHIEGALGVVLQRDTYARIGEARAAVTRAEVELEATRARLDATQTQHEADVAAVSSTSWRR
jgi:transcriptional regulator with XRE-family HTH domain